MLGYVLTAAAAALVTAGYNSMAPRSQLYGRTFIGNRNKRQLALTYDDGPSASYTAQLLDVLARHQVHATFFMLGQHVALLPKLAEEVARAGHVVGNHTYTHPNLIFAPPGQVRLQLEACQRALSDAIGPHSNLFRPPFGGRRPDVLRQVRALGLEPVMWSVTAYDWKSHTAEKIEADVTRHVRGGDVILMHDGGYRDPGADRSATVTATDRLIRRYKDQGYEFVTVPEMMGG